MKFTNTSVMNFEGAFRGLRNPLESWDRSDSFPEILCEDNKFHIGKNDLDLAKRLIKAGTEHRKFLRQIFISVDITAPLYWWKEFDTYKIGTVGNSTSTMHKIQSKPITLDCFEISDYERDLQWTGTPIAFDCDLCPIYNGEYSINYIIDILEGLRKAYIETKDKRYWKELIRWLPSGWLQTRTVTMNYENVFSMYRQRYNPNKHKLTEWHSFGGWCETLPYFKELFLDE